ncbi:hypothetical protein NPIL_690331 [Nephila pilipes]|uniref:Uncharacterized protein n=1 Tax=Nephila pilipes TaxID=299642 RepID=A0A8X6PKJ1_NEPPI|nr:hypothetical protein NPIL_690331 [Nephila pilipes]
MVIARILEMCFHVIQWALRAFAGFDLLYFIEIILFDLMIEFIDYSSTQIFNGSVFGRATTLETIDAAAVAHSPIVQKTYEALEFKSKLVPQEETMTITETPYKRNDQVATVPVVRSLFVWKMCQALDLPATFVPQENDTTLSCKQFKVNKPVPIVYSVAVFEMCKTLELKAQLADQ